MDVEIEEAELINAYNKAVGKYSMLLVDQHYLNE